jgi:hypothetical protein
MSTPVLVRFPPALLASLDAARAAQSPSPTRPAAIRGLLVEALSGGAAAAWPPDDVRELRQKFLLLAKRVEEMTVGQG